MQSVKRFIAGACCPQCQRLDKIRCWHDGDRYFSECVSCDYSEEMDKDGLRSENIRSENKDEASHPDSETVQVIKLPGE